MSYYDPTMAPPRTCRQTLVFVSFYGVFLAIGLFIVLFALWYFLWEQWRSRNQFIETEGLVLEKRILAWEGDLRPQVRVRYRAGEQEIESWGSDWSFMIGEDGRPPAVYDAIQIGEKRIIWFDPDRPSRFVLDRTYHIHWLVYPMVAVGLFFTLFAGNTIVRGLISWRKSRRQCLA